MIRMPDPTLGSREALRHIAEEAGLLAVTARMLHGWKELPCATADSVERHLLTAGGALMEAGRLIEAALRDGHEHERGES